MKVILRLAIAFLVITATSNAEAASRCASLFSSIPNDIKAQALYNKDFGAGVFVWKVSQTEFRIEPPPPPIIVNTAREAQKKLGDLAKNNSEDKFTVLFQGLSEGEVLAFKAMLQRDARFENDGRLSSVLLETEAPKTDASNEAKGYELIRNSAVRARDLLLRRYDWANAKVSPEVSMPRNPRQELYRLTVEQSTNSESFLLKLQVKSLKFVKNRTSQIMTLLAAHNLKNATPEQLAHTVITELKKSDKGISDGTLKVMAGDFIIAQTMGIEGG